MNSEPIPSDRAQAMPVAGATLQAILQLSDGGMDSIAVPVPLPEVVIRVQAKMQTETYFRRARSADSVVRYIEELPVLADGGSSASDAGPRRCVACGADRAVLYVAKLSPNERVSPATPALCEPCYLKGSADAGVSRGASSRC
jgi:hypothetical protein